MALFRSTDSLTKHRNGFRLVAVIGAILLVGGTASGATAGKAKHAAKPVLHIGMAGDVITLNPLAAPSGVGITNTFYALAYAPLIHQKPDGTYAPGLATSWRYFKIRNGVNKGFELTLRHNAKFSDGTPVTGAAVAADLDAYAKGTASFATWLGPHPIFTSPSKYTVRIVMQIPTPSLDYTFSDGGLWGWIESPQAVANPTLAATGTYGAGPYMMDQAGSVRGDHYKFVPNPYYYDKAAIKYSEVDVKIIANSTSMLQAMQSGQIDVAQGDPAVASNAKAAGLKVLAASYGVQYGYLNALSGPTDAAAPLKDVRVRQALNYALDRKALVQAILFGYGKATSAMEPIDSNPHLQNYYPYNPTKAKQLLAAAGYAKGFKLTIACFATPSVQNLVAALAKYWTDIGINAQYTCAGDIGTYLNQIRTTTSLSSLAALGQPTPQLYNTFVGNTSPVGMRSFRDAEAYKLYFSGLNSPNPKPAWTKMWTRLTKLAYYVPFFEQQFVWFVGPHVTGVTTTNARLGTILPLEWSPK